MGFRFHLVIVLLFLSAATCESYTLNNIKLVVDEAGTVTVEEKLIVQSGESEVRVRIPSNHEMLKVLWKGETPLDYKIVEAEDGVDVVARVDAGSARSVELTVSYASRHLTSKSGGVWTLTFPARIDPYRTIVQVALPQNTTILDWGPKTRFTPTENGLFVYPEQEEYELLLNYTVGGSGMVGAPAFMYYAAAFVVLVLALLVFYRRRSSLRADSAGIVVSPPPVEVLTETPRTFEVEEDSSTDSREGAGGRMKESVYQMLEENERKIVDVLLSKDEDVTQAQVCRETGIPKATLSDLMRRLEKRNVVEREREGRRNWVKLKEWVFK